MRKILFITLFFIFGFFYAKTQDTVQYVEFSNSYKFKDGIFFNIDEIKENRPIPLNKIIISNATNSLAFWDQLLSSQDFEYIDENGNKIKEKTEKIFAVSIKGKLYININGELFPLPFLGTFTFFIATVPVLTYDYSPYYMFDYTDFPTATAEPQQFILDFNTGQIYLFNLRNFEKLLKESDVQLYMQFKQLPKRKRKKQIFVYLRQYNEIHPLKLIKN